VTFSIQSKDFEILRNLAGEKPQIFVEINQKNNLKTIPGASINLILTKKLKKKSCFGYSMTITKIGFN
jgi:hypothetical protein